MDGPFRIYRNYSGDLSVSFNVQRSFNVFDQVARYLQARHGAKIVEQVTDHLDTRYWDFEVDGRLVTLHVDWAVFSISAGEPAAEPIVRKLAADIAAFLAGPETAFIAPARGEGVLANRLCVKLSEWWRGLWRA